MVSLGLRISTHSSGTPRSQVFHVGNTSRGKSSFTKPSGATTAARARSVEVDEVVLADGVLAAESVLQDLAEQLAQKTMTRRLGHVPLRIR